jgi:hypothetical protein
MRPSGVHLEILFKVQLVTGYLINELGRITAMKVPTIVLK